MIPAFSTNNCLEIVEWRYILMTYLCMLVYLLGITGLNVILAKRKFAEMLPISVLSSVLVLYVFSVFGKFSMGTYLLILLSASSLVLCFFYLSIKRDEVFISNYFSFGFYLFLLLFTFICVLNFSRGFNTWDEFSHWGHMVKEILRLDCLYCVPESTLQAHKEYPPALPIFEAFWCKISILMGKGYKESNTYMALQTLMISLFFPLFKNYKNKNKTTTTIHLFLFSIFIIIAQIVIPVAEAAFYSTIYADCAMVLIFAYCVLLILSTEKFEIKDFCMLSVGLSVLLLTKEMGLFFFTLTILLFTIKERKDLIYFYTWKKRAYNLILLIFFPLILNFSWKKYEGFYVSANQFDLSKMSVFAIPQILIGTEDYAEQHSYFVSFSHSIISNEIISRPISLTYWQLSIIFAVILLIFSRKVIDRTEKSNVTIINFLMLVSSAFYLMILLMMYIFPMGLIAGNGTGLEGFARYTSTYVFAYFEVMIMIMIYHMSSYQSDRTNLRLATGICITSCVAISGEQIYEIRPQVSEAEELYDDAEFIEKYTEEYRNIFVIHGKRLKI